MPPIEIGWLTSRVSGRDGPPGASVTSTSARNSRAAPRCTGPVSNLTSKSVTLTVNGARSASVNRAPAEMSSYWVRVLEKPEPTTTTLLPRKPNSPPIATPASSRSRLRWKTRLPASRR